MVLCVFADLRPVHLVTILMLFILIQQLKGSVEKGDKYFNSPKMSEVKEVFLLVNKVLRLLKFSLTALLSNQNIFLTFDLYWLLNIPFPTGPFSCTCYWAANFWNSLPGPPVSESLDVF